MIQHEYTTADLAEIFSSMSRLHKILGIGAHFGGYARIFTDKDRAREMLAEAERHFEAAKQADAVVRRLVV